MTREVLYNSEVNDWQDLNDLAYRIYRNTIGERVMVYGQTGRWDGPMNGGRYLDDLAQLIDRLNGGGDASTVYRITDRRGECPGTKVGDIVIVGSHHDGTNRYTIRCTDPLVPDAESFMEFKKVFDDGYAIPWGE